MTAQPVALRLADDLDAEFVRGRITNYTGRNAAAELRRLYEEYQWLVGEVADRNRRALEGDEAVAELKRVHAYYEGLHTSNKTLSDSVAAKADRIDRLGEIMERLHQGSNMTQPMGDLTLPQGYDKAPADYTGKVFLESQIREYTKKAVEAEREACAKLVEESEVRWLTLLADAIRARGNT